MENPPLRNFRNSVNGWFAVFAWEFPCGYIRHHYPHSQHRVMDVATTLSLALCFCCVVIAGVSFAVDCSNFPAASSVFAGLSLAQLLVLSLLVHYDWVLLEDSLRWSLLGVVSMQTLWFASPSVRAGWAVGAGCVQFLVAIYAEGRLELLIVPVGVCAMHVIIGLFCTDKARRRFVQ